MQLPLRALFSKSKRLGFENRQLKRQSLRKRLVPPRRVRLEFDWLEQRLVPSTITWKAAVSGNWSTPANWTGGVAPGPTDDVVIDAAGANYTITLKGSVSVNS